MYRFSWLKAGWSVLAAGLLTGVAAAATWFPLGPFGGSARSFAVDPADTRHLFLGTATGWVYDSHDGGVHWTRVAQISKRNDLVIDHIVADRGNPKRLIVGAYTVDHLQDGGIFISEDYGKSWYAQAEMRGQSVRSLARSPSDAQELIAGTLRGVFQSKDNGVHWQQISPVDSTEIKEVQSIAIDPANPGVIYAGTWHLPWKTTDGGTTWSNIKNGIIDDSDVFSIIVDPQDPKVVYASACSGIYKSSDAGSLFHKVQGIPSTARRTRTLEQDPADLNTVYAGTTEGLYRTSDAGAHWERLTASDVIVNDVYVAPDNHQHVLIATDRGGVYRSEDAGVSFEASNDGFSARQVIAYAADAQSPSKIYVGVVNDKTTGGVFQSTDGGVKWQQTSDGLGGQDVFSLLSLPDGSLLAGTGHGIYHLQGSTWQTANALVGGPVERTPETPSKSSVSLPGPTHLHPAGPAAHKPVPSKSKSGPPAEHARPTPAQKTGTARKSPAKSHANLRHRVAYATPASPRGRLQVVSWQSHTGSKSVPRNKRAARVVPGVKAKHSVPVSRTKAAKTGARAGLHPVLKRVSGQKAASAPAAVTAKPAVRQGAAEAKKSAPDVLDAVVYSLSRAGDSLYAGSSSGLLRSTDMGAHWTAIRTLKIEEVHSVAVSPKAPAGGAAPLLVAGLTQLALSQDDGTTWSDVSLPQGLTQVAAATIDGQGSLWVGGREGVWYSTDKGATWQILRNLFFPGVDNLFYDAAHEQLLVTSANSSNAFSVAMDEERKVSYIDTGWNLRFVRRVGDYLVGATLFDGVVVQPRMVDSPVNGVAAAKP